MRYTSPVHSHLISSYSSIPLTAVCIDNVQPSPEPTDDTQLDSAAVDQQGEVVSLKIEAGVSHCNTDRAAMALQVRGI